MSITKDGVSGASTVYLSAVGTNGSHPRDCMHKCLSVSHIYSLTVAGTPKLPLLTSLFTSGGHIIDPVNLLPGIEVFWFDESFHLTPVLPFYDDPVSI